MIRMEAGQFFPLNSLSLEFGDWASKDFNLSFMHSRLDYQKQLQIILQADYKQILGSRESKNFNSVG